MSAIAIIPARSGSKGLPDKNIRLLNGIPLMAYTIQAAKESGCFSEIHVSTDSPQYAQIASDFGAQTPFLRSMDTSSDTASSWDVVKEVLQEYEKRGKTFDKVMLLQPTSPLRNSNDIKECFNMMDSVSANSIISVCEMDHSPLWSNTLHQNHSMDSFLNSEIISTPRQALQTYYRINGAIYLLKVKYFKEFGNVYHHGSYAYLMERSRSIDIDKEIDFVIAESLVKHFLSYNIISE
jgi:CMP-N,N'-diacetyllegionaminic acid synthase